MFWLRNKKFNFKGHILKILILAAGGVPPPILKLKKLKTLILKYHLLKFIPDEVRELVSLKEFDVSHNPQLTSLTAELSGLPLKSELFL